MIANSFALARRAILLVFVINMAILAHTLLGLLLVGFFPSIAACYATYRANFAESNRWAARVTMVMILARPLCSLLLIVVVILAFLATLTWPGILAAFGLSSPIGLATGCVYAAARLPGMKRDLPAEAHAPTAAHAHASQYAAREEK